MTTTVTRAFTQAEAAGILRNLGFPVATTAAFAQSVGTFQAGWNLGPELLIDELVGPKTTAALAASEQRRKAGQPTASEHFSFAEFACQCRATQSGCRGLLVLRPLLQGLEKLRAKGYPHGLSIVSGYRCPGHNRAIKGAAQSQHLYGSACDVARVVHTKDVAQLTAFSGIGFQKSSGLVRHVDVRGMHPWAPNTTGSTAGRPAEWVYEA